MTSNDRDSVNVYLPAINRNRDTGTTKCICDCVADLLAYCLSHSVLFTNKLTCNHCSANRRSGTPEEGVDSDKFK